MHEMIWFCFLCLPRVLAFDGVLKDSWNVFAALRFSRISGVLVVFYHSFLLADQNHPLFLAFFVKLSQSLVVVFLQGVLFLLQQALSL